MLRESKAASESASAPVRLDISATVESASLSSPVGSARGQQFVHNMIFEPHPAPRDALGHLETLTPHR